MFTFLRYFHRGASLKQLLVVVVVMAEVVISNLSFRSDDPKDELGILIVYCLPHCSLASCLI